MCLHSSDTGNEMGIYWDMSEFKKTYDHLLGGKFCIIFSWSPPATILSALKGINSQETLHKIWCCW